MIGSGVLAGALARVTQTVIHRAGCRSRLSSARRGLGLGLVGTVMPSRKSELAIYPAHVGLTSIVKPPGLPLRTTDGADCNGGPKSEAGPAAEDRPGAHGLWHRGDLRLPGPRPARPRFRPQVRLGRPRRRGARGEDPASFTIEDEAYVGPGRIANSDFLDGMTVDEAKAETARRAEDGGYGTRTVNYRLRDWGVSRHATGAARSRSSIATIAASCQCPRPTCRWCCPRT